MRENEGHTKSTGTRRTQGDDNFFANSLGIDTRTHTQRTTLTCFGRASLSVMMVHRYHRSLQKWKDSWNQKEAQKLVNTHMIKILQRIQVHIHNKSLKFENKFERLNA